MRSNLARGLAGALALPLLASCTDVVAPADRAGRMPVNAPGLALVPSGPARLLVEGVELPPVPIGTITDWSGTFTSFHEPIRVPEGTWRVDIDVAGFATMSHPDVGTVSYGPGGLSADWTGMYGQRIPLGYGRVAMSFINDRPARVPTWQAWDVPADVVSASGSLIVRGPGRLEVIRGGEPILGLGSMVWNRWGETKFTLHLTPLHEEQTNLQVRCPTVVRGTAGRCVASMADNSRFTVTHWNFTSPPDPGSTENVTVDLDADSIGWGGTLVRGGTVTVTAMVNGREQKASTPLVVTDRDWSGKTADYSFQRIENGDQGLITLASRIDWSDDLGSANFFLKRDRRSSTPDFGIDVYGGPNDGIEYFGPDATIRFFGYYVVNTAVMVPTSAFYQVHEQSRQHGTRIGGSANVCDRSLISGSLESLVIDHELYHGEVYKRALDSLFSATIAEMEKRTASDASDLAAAYVRAWSELDLVARARSMAVHTDRSRRGLLRPTDSQGQCNLLNESTQILTSRPQ